MVRTAPAKRREAGSKDRTFFRVSTTVLVVALCLGLAWAGPAISQEAIPLPAPSLKGTVSVEEALESRRTTRAFSPRQLTTEQLSQILWAAYGVTARKYGRDLKTAPSAGALYPIDVYALVGGGGVTGFDAGVYRFMPGEHSVKLVKKGDLREKVARACLHQTWIASAPAVFVITGEYKRSTVKYGERGVTYTRIESGCVGQNIFLQAEALGLRAGIVGAFQNARIIEALDIPESHDPLLVMPVGFPAGD